MPGAGICLDIRVSRRLPLGEVVEQIAEDNDQEERAKEARIARWFLWLADHPLSDTWRRIFVFSAFTLLSLLELFTF